MGQFYDIQPGSMTPDECDSIAIKKAGVIESGFGYGYACPKGGPLNEEYEARVIGTCGMGNHGRIVLRGLTPRARSLICEGKVLHLTRSGIPWVIARVAPSMQYGMELDVCQVAADLVEAVRMRGPFKGHSHRAFADWAGVWTDNLEMSFPRKDAAAEIAAAAVGR